MPQKQDDGSYPIPAKEKTVQNFDTKFFEGNDYVSNMFLYNQRHLCARWVIFHRVFSLIVHLYYERKIVYYGRAKQIV